MATGIVFGRILHANKAPVIGVRVVLDYVQPAGGEYRRAAGLPIEARHVRPGCPPYGVCAETNAEGSYVLLYDWPGDLIGDVVSSLIFRIMCFDSTQTQYRLVGRGECSGGVLGLDIRSLMISQVWSLDAASVDYWTGLILGTLHAFPCRWRRDPTSEGTRGPLPRGRGIQVTPHGGYRTTPPGAVPRPPEPEPPMPAPGGSLQHYVQGALGVGVSAERYILATKIDVRLGYKRRSSV